MVTETADSFFYTPDLLNLIPEVPSDSILSRTFYTTDGLKAILFSFAAGQELSEHTSSRPAILHFLAGTADLTLGDKIKTAEPGTWAYMQPRLPHSVIARTDVVMLLLLL